MPAEDPEDKQVSSPFSAGGGGPRFEVQVQSAFAVLMLAGGSAPCLPYLPIKRIRLQGRQAGYATDDFVAYVGDQDQTDERRLLVQIKHGIAFTKSNKRFGEAIAAAWKDFNNPASFTREKDAVAVIAGPLSATDIEDMRRILDWARSCASSHEFFEKVNATNFSSAEKREKLGAFRNHINAAAGSGVLDSAVFEFLRHFHVLGYDLDVRSGFMHALLHAIVGRHNPEDPAAIWARILEHVASFNQDAGTLTAESFPDDVRAAFAPRPVEVMPASLASALPPVTTLDWNTSEFAEALAVANLLGGWHEGCDGDMSIVTTFTPDQPTVWLRKMREVLQRPESPLFHANGVWTVKKRLPLWGDLASRIFGDTLKRFEECAKRVLGERDPKFDLDPEQRLVARIHGYAPTYSSAIRNGLAETLALLGTNTVRLPNCVTSAGETTAVMVVRGILEGAEWQLWASLNRLLPTLAEAAPNTFLDAVERSLRQEPCPFDTIFAQERDVFGGGNYTTGLLWALETLAWDEVYLVRVAVDLAALAARDPGGKWANRPANSLTTIFLPWFPQTHASIEKRRVAVQAIVREHPEVGWRLLMSLLPEYHSVSSGTAKPKWRRGPAAGELPATNNQGADVPRPTTTEYWDQISSYVQMAIEVVHGDPNKLNGLIHSLDSLPEPALDEVLAVAESDAITALPDERRLPIWYEMSALVRKHRRNAEAEWALRAAIVDKIDRAASVLAPQDPMVKNRVLFVTNTWSLHDDEDDWQSSEERLVQRQLDAMGEIFKIGGIAGVLAFAAQVENPFRAGFALGKLGSINVAGDLLPRFVLSPEPKYRQLVQGFVLALFHREQWAWFDLLDTESWLNDEIAQLLTYLPFDPETWQRANQRLGDDAKEYWTRVPIHSYQKGDSEYIAVDALLRHGRPRAAIACLASRVRDKLPLDANRAMNALLRPAASNEPGTTVDAQTLETLIKALQESENADKDKLLSVEWAYMALFEHSHSTRPTTLSAAIATDPHFFCQIIRTIFRSDRESDNEEKPEPTEEQRAIAMNAYRLLHGWSKVPGTDASGTISAELLKSWIDTVRDSLAESGHLDVGLQKAGEVFIHSPADPAGLFMSHAVANTLNRKDMDQLRRGYEMAVYNSRGGHVVDPTGAPEKALSAKFNQRADAVENAGYHRLAVTFRLVADQYIREAERLIDRAATDDRQSQR